MCEEVLPPDPHRCSREYVTAVQDQLSLEHRQWLEAAENMQAAVARLEKALSSGATQKDAASSEEGIDS